MKSQYRWSWFADLADTGSEQMFARACTAPTKANLQKLIGDLRGCKFAWCKGLVAHAKAILNGDLKQEYRYLYGGKATCAVSSYGKVSATSSLFSAIRQAARYGNWDSDRPPIKLPPAKRKRAR